MPACSNNADLLIIDVPKPKDRPFAASARTYTIGSTLLPEFHPSLLLKTYRKRALALGLNVLHKQPAFQCADGTPQRAEKLRERAGLSLFGRQGQASVYLRGFLASKLCALCTNSRC